MRWLRLTAPAALLAAWLGGSVAQQQGTPPAGTPPTRPPPAATPPASTPQPGTPRPAAPQQQQGDEKPPAAADDAEEEFIPTEELQPDAAVTFPVDI